MRARDEAIVDDVLRRTDCDGFADRPVSTLSGGERQRVLLALAAMYAYAIGVLHQGELVAAGDPVTVLTGELLRTVFGVDGGFVPDPVTQQPRLLLRALSTRSVVASPTL